MVNTGHDITIYMKDSNNSVIDVTAGPLSYKYMVDHIKFHFGSHPDRGSEHTIANKSFPAEVR